MEKLTTAGVEVEDVRHRGVSGENFVAARVVSFEKHPNADRLRLCQVEDGSGTRQIVCGASNFEAGDVVPLALPGAVMPAGFKIKKSKLRGETSEGMLCAAEELGLPGGEDGLLLLDRSTLPGTRIEDLFEPEVVLEIEVTPNRADLLSYRGLARELIALGAASQAGPLSGSLADGKDQTALELGEVDAVRCPRYTACRVDGVTVGTSPAWMQARLQAQGLRPINSVVDITNYVLMETGQPLHAFDADKVEGAIEVRVARTGESILALDGATYELTDDDLVIADRKGPIALAGVMGGELSGVDESTTSLLLESAEFAPSGIRRTASRTGLHSDSSYRFERGVDPAGVDLARRRALELIQEYSGGRAGRPVESSPPRNESATVILSETAVERLLGYRLEPSRVAEILTGLGLKDETAGQWLVPSYRPDLTREVDLLEEVARIEGLDRVEAVLPGGAAGRSTADVREDQMNRIRQTLAALGFFEMQTSSLIPSADQQAGSLTLKNPLNEDAGCLRSSLLETILPCVRHNISRGMETVRAFEMGRVYGTRDGKASESSRIVLVMSGSNHEDHWKWQAAESDYFEFKGVMERLVRGIPGWTGPETMGAVDSEQLRKFDIKQNVWAAEWDLPLGDRLPEPVAFEPVSPYPAVKRDLAFVVSRATSHAQIINAIQNADIEELESVICFDVFVDESGKKLPADQKSVAYSLTYRSPQRTLSDKDVQSWQERIIREIEGKLGGRLR